MKESPYVMMAHGIGISVIAYVIFRYGFAINHSISELRSIVIGLIMTLYMIVFGHGLPKM